MFIGSEEQAQTRDWERKSSLFDWINNCGQGLIGIPSREHLPEEMINFVREQYARFNIPFNADIDEVALIGAWAAYGLLDFTDPYLWLLGTSDVSESPDWRTKCFTFIDHSSPFDTTYLKRGEPANPEFLETFVFVPNQCENVFNEIMAKPGLENLPGNAGLGIKAELDGEYTGYEHDCFAELRDTDGCGYETLKAMTKENSEQARAYFELAAWAAFAWLVGPLSREWRYNTHDVFHLCLKDGISVIYDGAILGKENFYIEDRAPLSCSVCGVDAWCVEMTFIEGTHRMLCEKHVSDGIPLYGAATCGSRICRYVACQNHPAHCRGAAGVHETYRKSGQLTDMVRQGDMLRLPEYKQGIRQIAPN